MKGDDTMSYMNASNSEYFPLFVATDVDAITDQEIIRMISEHMTYVPRYQLLEDYYLGKHEILNRELSSEDKPNNQPIANYPRLIVDTRTGYFSGKPVSYKSVDSDKEDAETLELYNEIMRYNDEHDENAELTKLTGIFGYAFEIHYTDENADTNFVHISPKEMFVVYNDSLKPEIVMAVRYYIYTDVSTKERKFRAEIYKDSEVITAEGRSKGEAFDKAEKQEHYYGRVPVIEFMNNEEKQGDFETVINLIDSYELTLADSVNEINYMNDAYLVIKDVTVEDDDISDMKNNRVINLQGEGEAQWLVKSVNDTHIQNTLNRLDEDIHKFSYTPNMDDEAFGSASGTALKFRLYSLESTISVKERKFAKSLNNRIDLILGYEETRSGNTYDADSIIPVFSRNIPVNTKEQVEIASMLQNLVSKETLLAQLPMIEDAKSELDKVAEERETQYANFIDDNPDEE